jgi:putative DeoR family transcriptional regulator (stage III sporulation protein D)
MIYISPTKERCETLALYMIENNSTVRATAAHFGISKSTVHKDVTKILKGVNHTLYNRVGEILDKNKLERHIRGGEATRKKYKMEKLITENSKNNLPSFSQ